jgi:transcription-repair coupling factor (superfamily II helicase)
LGLAQLHQLRGRVGRSHHQAYAYLLTPPPDALTASAKKRLEAIQTMEDLGAGFYLAMHDLEIRGAGEVLGDSQSGGIHDVGFALYGEMLEHAVKSLKKGKEPDLSRPFEVATEVNLHAPALLPEAYCGDVHERLVIYKRLANCSSEEDLERLTEELVDRFGPLPDPARVLLECHKLRIQGAPLGVQKIDAAPSGIVVHFVPEPPVDATRVLALVQSSRIYRLPGPDRVRIDMKHDDMKLRSNEVRQFLKKLA